MALTQFTLYALQLHKPHGKKKKMKNQNGSVTHDIPGGRIPLKLQMLLFQGTMLVLKQCNEVVTIFSLRETNGNFSNLWSSIFSLQVQFQKRWFGSFRCPNQFVIWLDSSKFEP